MHYRYEKICIDAGCNDETTEDIRKYLNREASRLYRQRRVKEEEGIVFNRLSAFVNEDGDHIDLEDGIGNLEEEIFHEMALQEIRELLDKMPSKDKAFLLALYEDPGSERKVANALHVSRKTIRYRKNRLLRKMRKVLIDGEDAKKVF